MEQITSDMQSSADEVRHWQLKWGTPIPLCVKDTVEVRGYGQLDVEVSDPQQLAACLVVPDAQTITDTAHGRLKEIVVQTLQETADNLDLAAFPEDDGPLTLECIEQMMTDTSASLQSQLVGMGLELRAFVIMAGSYRYVRPRRPEQWTGGDEGLGCQAIPLERGFHTPVVPPEALSPLPVSETLKALMGLTPPPIDTPSSEDDLSLETMTSSQVADHLKITEAEVIQLIESGQLNGLKIGSEYRILTEWLEEYLNPLVN